MYCKNSYAKGKILRILRRISLVVLVVVVSGLAFIAIVPGYSTYFIRSGSMTPTLKPGDLVITRPVGGLFGSEIGPGSIVVFQRGNNVVTHRVIFFDNTTIVTKGDANEDPDNALVPVSQVLGIYFFKIPFVGYLVAFIRSKLGWFLTILFPTAALLGLLIKDIIKEALTPEMPKASRR